jgi:hypothetical protein
MRVTKARFHEDLQIGVGEMSGVVPGWLHDESKLGIHVFCPIETHSARCLLALHLKVPNSLSLLKEFLIPRLRLGTGGGAIPLPTTTLGGILNPNK